MQDRKYSLTFDIDWAPDFAIEKCLEMLDAAKVKATIFATHYTDLNQEIVRQGHTLGIHPNFLPNSTQGGAVKEIIENCLEFVPDAWCMRSHALVQSSPIFHEIFSNFPQLQLDVSLFMHRVPYVQRTKWKFDGVEFDRILYNWADEAEFSDQRFSDDQDMFFGDLTVYVFHPIHVFLNSSNGSEYVALKKGLDGKPLSSINLNEANSFCNRGLGVQSFLQSVLKSKAQAVPLEVVS